jgi:hypothetical protein
VIPINETIVLHIQRRVVEQKYTDSVEKYLHQLSAEGGSSFQKVVFIFEGYDDTVDEVYEIKEVRDWVYRLFRLFPHLMYFISPQFDSHITILACLGDVETVRIGSYPLTPNEYDALGIDIMNDLQRARYRITIEDDMFMAMEFALHKYAKSIGDNFGAARTLEMIRAVTNRWI